MVLIAKMPCTFNGRQFFIGEQIPADMVLDPKGAEAMGLLTIGKGENSPVNNANQADTIPLSICTDDEPYLVNITREGLQAAVTVLTGKVSGAEDVIRAMTDPEALIFLHACESRKTIREAAKARCIAISPTEETEKDEVKAGEA